MKVLAGQEVPPSLLEALDAEQPILITREENGTVVLLSANDLPPDARKHLQMALSDYVRAKLEQAGETPESVVQAFYDARKTGG